MGICFKSCKYILIALGAIMIFGTLFWLIMDMFKVKGQIQSQPWSKYIPNPGIVSSAAGTILGTTNQTFISNTGILTLGKGKTTLDNEGNINATGTLITSGLSLRNDTIYFQGNAFTVNSSGAYINGVSLNQTIPPFPVSQYAIYRLNASLENPVLITGTLTNTTAKQGTVYPIEFRGRGVFTSTQCTLGDIVSAFKNNETISLRSFGTWPTIVRCTNNPLWTEAFLYWG